MNFKHAVAGAIAAFAMSAVAFAANAAPTLFTNAGGLSGTFNTVTFDELTFPNATIITNQYSAYGITLNNGVMNYNEGFMLPNYVGNFGPDGLLPDFQISFNSAVTSAAFQLITNLGTSTFNAFLGAALVGTGSLGTGVDVAYYGFTGGAFDRIQILAPDYYPAFVLDNVQFAGGAVAVPEPATWGLMLIGFGVLGATLRLKRRSRAIA
jgi:hypothetical protein